MGLDILSGVYKMIYHIRKHFDKICGDERMANGFQESWWMPLKNTLNITLSEKESVSVLQTMLTEIDGSKLE